MDWISVNDRLPEFQGKRILIWTNGRIYLNDRQFVTIDNGDFGYYDKGKFYITGSFGQKEVTNITTHWMPFPEKP